MTGPLFAFRRLAALSPDPTQPWPTDRTIRRAAIKEVRTRLAEHLEGNPGCAIGYALTDVTAALESATVRAIGRALDPTRSSAGACMNALVDLEAARIARRANNVHHAYVQAAAQEPEPDVWAEIGLRRVLSPGDTLYFGPARNRNEPDGAS